MKKYFGFAMAFLAVLALAGCGAESDEVAAATTQIAATEASTSAQTHPEIIINEDDPYSYVIKAYRDFELDLPRIREMTEEEMLQHFKQFVQRFQMLPENFLAAAFFATQGVVYALHDINDDGVEELLIGSERSSWVVFSDIYTIQNGIAVQQLQAPKSFNYSMIIFENGTVRISGGRQGEFYDSYYRFNRGRLQLNTRLYSSELYHSIGDNVDVAFNYYNRGETISESEFKRLQNQYEGNRQEVELDWQPLWTYSKPE